MSEPDDLPRVVVSHPKSGRTWLRFMLAHALSSRPVTTLRDCAVAVPDIARLESPTAVAVTHEVGWLDRAPAGVVLLRDPGEVLVSFYFHVTEHRAADRFDGSFADFLDADLGLPGLASFLSDVADRVDSGPTLITYDALLADAPTALGQVIDALGLAADPDRIADAARASTFDSMRDIEAADPINDRFDTDRPNRNRVRAGRADRGAALLDADDRAQIRERLIDAVGPGLAALRRHLPSDWAL